MLAVSAVGEAAADDPLVFLTVDAIDDDEVFVALLREHGQVVVVIADGESAGIFALDQLAEDRGFFAENERLGCGLGKNVVLRGKQGEGKCHCPDGLPHIDLL